MGIAGLKITLTNTKMKDIIKKIRSIENRGILLKGTTGKIIIQKGGLFNFLVPLMRADLSLMKVKHMPLGKYAVMPLGLIVAASAIRHDYVDILNQRNARYHGNTQISRRTWFIE